MKDFFSKLAKVLKEFFLRQKPLRKVLCIAVPLVIIFAVFINLFNIESKPTFATVSLSSSSEQSSSNLSSASAASSKAQSSLTSSETSSVPPASSKTETSSTPPTSSTETSTATSSKTTSSKPPAETPKTPTVPPAKQPAADPEPPPAQPQSQMVWISGSGKKYHSSSECSNMKSPRQISIEQAKNKGLGPCSKCY